MRSGWFADLTVQQLAYDGGQDLVDVVAETAKDGKEGVAGGASHRAASEAAIGFLVSDFWPNGAAVAEIGDQLGLSLIHI